MDFSFREAAHTVALQNSCRESFLKFGKKTPAMENLFSKVTGLDKLKRTPLQVASCEFLPNFLE